MLTDADVRLVCAIAGNTSLGGPGRPLSDLLSESPYHILRKDLDAAVIEHWLLSHPSVVDQWIAYSEDKRTSGGWYLLEQGMKWETGRLDEALRRVDRIPYDTRAAACASYILLELDFWAGIPGPA